MKKKHRSNRNKELQEKVKQQLFEQFGFICMICHRHLSRHELQLHHIVKHEVSHTTTFEQSGIVCAYCHQEINYCELHNKQMYKELNDMIIKFKSEL
jgi:hypothetical protein